MPNGACSDSRAKAMPAGSQSAAASCFTNSITSFLLCLAHLLTLHSQTSFLPLVWNTLSGRGYCHESNSYEAAEGKARLLPLQSSHSYASRISHWAYVSSMGFSSSSNSPAPSSKSSASVSSESSAESGSSSPVGVSLIFFLPLRTSKQI